MHAKGSFTEARPGALRRGRGRRRAARLGAIALVGSLAACAPRLPALDVETQWAQAMARLSMFGVYPAREDVMVGDLLLYVPPAPTRGPGTGELARFLTTRLASAPCALLLAELSAQGRERPRVQPVAASGVALPAPVVAPNLPGTARPSLGQQGDRCGIPAPGTPARSASAGEHEIGSSDQLGTTPAVRLQRAAMPELVVARLTEGQLSGQALFSGVGAALGLSASGGTALTVKLKNIETLRLDPPRITDLLFRLLSDDYLRRRLQSSGSGSTDDVRLRLRPADLLRALEQRSTPGRLLGAMACGGQFEALARLGARVIVVNDVIYTRQIEYAFNRRSAIASELAVDAQGLLQLGTSTIPAIAPTPATAAAAQGGGAAQASNTAATAPSAAAQAALEAVRRTVTGGTAASNAGLSTTFGVSSTGDLALTTHTARPLAVGFGAALEYSIEQALIPTRESDIDEAMSVCASLIGQPMSQRTHDWLAYNLNWLKFVATDDREGLRAHTANTDPALVRSRREWPPIFPR